MASDADLSTKGPPFSFIVPQTNLVDITKS